MLDTTNVQVQTVEIIQGARHIQHLTNHMQNSKGIKTLLF